METEQMIKRLRYLAEKHKNDKVGTCQTRWSDLCSDVADRLEEQTASLKNTFEMPVKIGSCVWGSDDPYEPGCSMKMRKITKRITRNQGGISNSHQTMERCQRRYRILDATFLSHRMRLCRREKIRRK